MTDNPNLAKMSDAEYRENVAKQKREGSQNLNPQISEAGQAALDRAARNGTPMMGVDVSDADGVAAYRARVASGAAANSNAAYIDTLTGINNRNSALLALGWITGVSFVLGLILVIAGAANMNVQASIFSGATSDPGLPWLIIGGGLLNLGTVCVLALLIVHAVRWRESD